MVAEAALAIPRGRIPTDVTDAFQHTCIGHARAIMSHLQGGMTAIGEHAERPGTRLILGCNHAAAPSLNGEGR